MEPSTTVSRLLDKCVQVFILAIDTYNRPTVTYRAEAFSLLLCNGWELMLKAFLVKTKGVAAIYYKDKPNRTISLTDAIKKVFTNKNDPVRINLELIVALRNKNTHFVTVEHELIYGPIFQASVRNFAEKILELHEIKISDSVHPGFLVLPITSQDISDQTLIGKYGNELAKILIDEKKTISDTIGEGNEKIAITVNHHVYLTKKQGEADATWRLSSEGEHPLQIIKQIQDPEKTHPYTQKTCITEIKVKLKSYGLNALPTDPSKEFNKFHFNCFVDTYNLKADLKFTYLQTVNEAKFTKYSSRVIDFILDEFKKDPECIEKLLKLKKEANPRGEGF